MKYTLIRPLTLVVLLGVLLPGLTISQSAAETTAPSGPQDVGTIVVAPGATAAQVKNAIVTALTKRKWTVKSADDTTVVGYLKHRSYESTLTFRYDEKAIDIMSDSYEIDSDGKRLGRENPSNWIKNLKNDIPRYLATEMAAAK